MTENMNDRELLELAAKAAGVAIIPCTCSDERWPFKHDESVIGKRGHWNPLIDDGDALRLAIRLNEYEPYKSRGGFRLSTGLAVEGQRVAIVRAAAEIGRGI